MDELDLARERRNALRREQYRLDGGKRKAENQAWKESHREQVRLAGRDYQRLRRVANLEAERERQREWRRSNPEKAKQNRARWYAKNGRAYDRAWHAKNRVKDPVLYMLRNCKNRAKEIGQPFNLTRADIIVPDVCPVLGIPIQKGSAGFHPNSPSVDRFDSTKGYVSGNVNVISWRANALKRDGTLDEFRKIVAYLERG